MGSETGMVLGLELAITTLINFASQLSVAHYSTLHLIVRTHDPATKAICNKTAGNCGDCYLYLGALKV